MKIKHITLKHKDFPENLLNIPTPPKELFYLGDLELLKQATLLSVVGTRKPTTYGKQVINQIIPDIVGAGVAIVSGLALGIDGLAHRACLKAGGKTIAVMGCGLDHIYPTSHRQLALDILKQGGAIISEYESGMPALPQNFIARNRLISGLSTATLIIEAATKSGTLHTANFALDQGKTVMAVPGNITNPLSSGTNNLIQAGALPITSSADVLTALGISANDNKRLARGDDEIEQNIIDLLASGITDGEELFIKSGINQTSQFQQAMTMLEISGKIHPLGANHWGLS